MSLKRRALCLTCPAAVLIVAVAFGAEDNGAVFLSFEDQADLPKVEASRARVELSTEHATAGSRSLKVTDEVGPYPTVGFKLGCAFDNADWTQYEALAFDLYNPQQDGVGLYLEVFDGTGARRTVTCPIRHQGEARLRTTPVGLKLKTNGLLLTGTNLGMVQTWDQDIDLSNVTRFVLFMEGPKEPTTIYLDNFRFLPRRDEPLLDRFGQYTPPRLAGKGARRV